MKIDDPISNETENTICCEPLYRTPIDDNMYIIAYMTSSGVPDCGLYFKIIKFKEGSGELESRDIVNICRISMKRPEYITGFDETFVLNSDQKLRLQTILSNQYFNTGKTGWEYLYWILENEIHDCFYDGSPYENVIIPVYNLPDYTKL